MFKKANKFNYKRPLLLIAMVMIFAVFYLALENDATLYQEPIVRVTDVQTLNSQREPVSDIVYNQYYYQSIEAVFLNTQMKGNKVLLENSFTLSKAYNDYYHKGDQVFLKATASQDVPQISYAIIGLKRDQQLISIILLFVFAVLLIGGKKGLRSLGSVLVNILILSGLLYFYREDYNIHLITFSSALLFIITSMAFVTGFNKKTLAASLGTALGTAASVLIAYFVFSLIDYKGVHYEEMEFMLTSPIDVFYLELVIGTLGGIMDIAVSMASSVEELLAVSPNIQRTQLLKSGFSIGNDMMVTMANTLIFAYLSGSIPLILLLMKNNINIGFVFNLSISLELLRALVGSIGIVISIPITLAVAIFLLHSKKETMEI